LDDTNPEQLELFLCGVDWQHELGEASGGTRFYGSLADIERHRGCVTECGVVKVTASFSDVTWVKPQDFSRLSHPRKAIWTSTVSTYDVTLHTCHFLEGTPHAWGVEVSEWVNDGKCVAYLVVNGIRYLGTSYADREVAKRDILRKAMDHFREMLQSVPLL
jgi:hypothetical protein